jgi:hypothetical protein
MKALMEMIVLCGCLSVFAKFHEQTPIKTIFLAFFYNCNIVTTLLQIENVLQLLYCSYVCQFHRIMVN